ncbi:hypothetical protein D9757_000465 [Collybiopsis confluens]|uniref:Uncharacterized protein n=1 Tax=Collybiopsis confluens TaxID=2823264 RepID=A0A8H5MG86_9AGAR|nr:hypothetical protein D9757_000465 [Collybiopsis confluens]
MLEVAMNMSISVHHSGPAYVGEEYPVEIVIRGCPCRDADIQGALKERDYSKEEIVDVVMDVLLQPVETDVTAVNTIFIDTYQSNAMIKGIPLGSLALHPHSTSKSPAEIKRTLWIKNTGGAGDRVVDMGVRTNLVGDENSAANPRLETETLETISIPCTEPLKVSYDIEYRRRAPPGPSVGFAEGSGKPWWLFDSMEGDGEDEDESVSTWAERAEADTEAIVRMTLECMGSSGVQVEKVRLKSKKNSKNVRIFSSEVDLEDKEAADMFPLVDTQPELLPRDEFCDICRIGISNLNEDDDKDDEEIPSPGEYEILWRRILPSGEHGPLSSTLLPLPSLHPPPDELVALLDVPPSAKLHEPIPLTLTVRNCHPSRTAAVYVQLEASSSANVNDASTTGASVQAQISDVSSAGSPGFIVAGLRSGRVPLLLAGAEERLTWMLIPIECGNVKLPTIRVFDRRKGSKGGLGALVGAGSEEADINEGIRNSMDIEGQGREVKVVDVRVERRRGRVIPIDGQGRGPALEEVQRIGTVLVLP